LDDRTIMVAMNTHTAAQPWWPVLTAAPHRLHFFCGLVALAAASAWWGLHLVARYTGTPLFALDLAIAPIWAHAFLMLFAAFPTVIFGFLFTVYPRWMDGPLVRRRVYIATALLFSAGTLAWLAGTFAGLAWLLAGCALAGSGLLAGIAELMRILVAAPKVVEHAVVTLIALCVQAVALAGFAYGVVVRDDFALHYAVRVALWGGLLPLFFAVCHRMIPFFSQGVVRGYVPWRPLWILVGVVTLAYGRLLLGAAGALAWLPLLDAALFALTAWCFMRWTALGARGNPLLWTLYAGFAWLPLAVLLQTVRDTSFTLTGAWALGRAPVHALGMGFFGGMLIAMVTRVTMGHSGRPLHMDRYTLGCFLAVQLAAVGRVSSEIVTAPLAVKWLLFGSLALWLAAMLAWSTRVGGIYLRPRIDGRPG
jgi:uncharacterized protein involved in response to NO